MVVLKELSAIKGDIEEIKSILKTQRGNIPKKEILTAIETMELLNIKRSTFDHWRRVGFIKVYAINKRLYTKYSEIMEVVNNGLIEVN